MHEHILADTLEWLEENTKPLFVLAALILYGLEILSITTYLNPLEDLNDFLLDDHVLVHIEEESETIISDVVACKDELHESVIVDIKLLFLGNLARVLSHSRA